jgi:DNA-binding transcriptional MerR regulator
VATVEKSPDALKTIGELSQELGVAQHILRYWETKFPQLRPMQRAGNRRYYRRADVDLARRINRLLNEEGYTVRGVQKLLRERGAQSDRPAGAIPIPPREPDTHDQPETLSKPETETWPPMAEVLRREEPIGVDVFRLIALRNRLADALGD